LKQLLFQILALCVLTTPALALKSQEALRQIVLRRDLGAPDALAQSPDGFIWVGGARGLFRFDGLSFEPESELGNQQVRRLFATTTSELWVATGVASLESAEHLPVSVGWRNGDAGLFHRGADGVWHDYSRATGLPNPWVWSFAESPDGTVALGTEAGVVLYRNKAWSQIPASALPSGLVTSLQFSTAQRLWIGTSVGLAVADLRDGSWRVQPTPLSSGTEAVMRMHRIDDTLMVLTDKAMYSAARGRDQTGEVSFQSSFAIDGFDDFSVDASGSTWLVGMPGIRRWKPGQTAPVRVAGLENAIRAHVLLLDREDSVWFGSRALSALTQLKPARAHNIGPEEGLSGTVAFSVLPAPNGEIWTVTAGGLNRVDAEGRIHSHDLGPTIRKGFLRSLALAPDGRVWISAESSIAWHDGKNFGAHALVPPVSGDHLNGMTFAASALWVTWSKAGVSRIDTAGPTPSATHFGVKDGLCPGGYEFVHAGPNGTVWFGGKSETTGLLSGQLVRYRDGKFECLDTAQGLPPIDVLGVSEDEDGALWMALRSIDGLARYHNGKTTMVSVRAQAPRGPYFSVTDDRKGNLWVTSANGVFRFVKSELLAHFDGKRERIWPYVVNADTGMRSEECISAFAPRAALDGDGWLWVSTLHGISALPPAELIPLPNPAAVVDGIFVAGSRQKSISSVTFTAGSPVEIRFTSPTFIDPHKVRFSYRMQGLEQAFTPAGSGRAANYGALPAGRYRFELKAVSDSAANPDASVTHHEVLVIVTPPIYATWWFRGLAVLMLSLVGLGIYRVRVASLRRRYAEVEAERGRIARDLHDDLAQGFLAVGLLLDALRTGLGRVKEVPAALSAILEDARSTLNETRQSARHAIWNIRSEKVDRPSLQELLEALFTKTRKNTGVELVFSNHGGPVPSSGILEYEVPRIVTQALTNAIAHGRAARIDVQLQHNDEGLVLSIVDNGKGMSEADLGKGGVGIVGMQERAAQLGGQLSVSTRSDASGVEVRLVVPRAALKSSAVSSA